MDDFDFLLKFKYSLLVVKVTIHIVTHIYSNDACDNARTHHYLGLMCLNAGIRAGDQR